MVIDGLANAIINVTMFTIFVLIIKGIQIHNEKNYEPVYWISLKKCQIKLLLYGVITALLYKLSLGFIGIISGTMILKIDQSGIAKTIIFTLSSSFGFLGVALFEEGLFRGYLMQVLFRKLPKLLAIILQALIFGVIHYRNYSVLSNTWIRTIDAILIGIIFGTTVIKTKSLMFVIGAHLFYNTAEQILFLDNPYKFTRFISFNNSNNLISIIFHIEFIELIILFIIALSLIFLFRKDILYREINVKYL